MAGSFSRTRRNFVQKTLTTSGPWLKLGEKFKIIVDVLSLKIVLLKRIKTQRRRKKFLNDEWL